jgi:hypothetical protein
MQQRAVSRSIASIACRNGVDCIDAGVSLRIAVSSLNIQKSSVTGLSILPCRKPILRYLIVDSNI